jgi:hypothetical protein
LGTYVLQRSFRNLLEQGIVSSQYLNLSFEIRSRRLGFSFNFNGKWLRDSTLAVTVHLLKEWAF